MIDVSWTLGEGGRDGWKGGGEAEKGGGGLKLILTFFFFVILPLFRLMAPHRHHHHHYFPHSLSLSPLSFSFSLCHQQPLLPPLSPTCQSDGNMALWLIIPTSWTTGLLPVAGLLRYDGANRKTELWILNVSQKC